MAGSEITKHNVVLQQTGLIFIDEEDSDFIAHFHESGGVWEQLADRDQQKENLQTGCKVVQLRVNIGSETRFVLCIGSKEKTHEALRDEMLRKIEDVGIDCVGYTETGAGWAGIEFYDDCYHMDFYGTISRTFATRFSQWHARKLLQALGDKIPLQISHHGEMVKSPEN